MSSTPEWMKKFEEIGQKGDEEVTEIGEQGFVKHKEQRRSSESLKDMAAAVSSFTDPAQEDVEDDDGGGGDDDDAAGALFRAAGSTSDGSTQGGLVMRTSRSEDPPESASMDVVSSSPSSTDGNGDVESKTDSEQEDMGESWVVDRGSTQNRAGVSRSTFGESFVTEEIFVDEDGNEIFVDEDGNELQEEEVLVDEDGDEIFPTQQLNNEGLQQAAPSLASSRYYGQGNHSYVPPYTRRSQTAPVYDIEEQKRILGVGKTGKRSRMSWCIPLLMCASVLAAVLLVLFFVVFNEDSSPTAAPISKIPPILPEASSSGGIEAAATTEFDPIRNRCNFSGLTQPNVIDQCNCEGFVTIIADDVRTRWQSLVNNFIPSIYPDWKESVTSCSPENQALLWLSSGINNGGEIDALLRLQRYILAVVYYAQGGPGWDRSTNWLSEKIVCDWEGVQCNQFAYVYLLDLGRNGLTGELSDAPTKLNAIEGYWVGSNDLVGTIPDSYLKSDTLTFIDFSNNGLSGEFPSNISNNSTLDHINFSSNKLTGQFPRQIRRIATLTKLNIESNDFTGVLPNNLFKLPLTQLTIGGNKFEGTIPTQLSTVSTLTSLSIGPNLFTGEIPVDLVELTDLEQLSIVGIPGLGGRLPANYGFTLTKLVELDISDTNVEGNIPGSLSLLSNLTKLRLSNNSLRGNIPSGFGLLSNLEYLHLDGNVLSGAIPSNLGLLTGLKELQLHSNLFFGTIPEEFENLLEMKTLTLNGNLFSGRAPDGVCALRDAQLNKFVVDCPARISESEVDGIICTIPSCCTECIEKNI